LAVACFSTGTGRAVTILPLGDSITYGYLSASEQGSNGYRAQLYADLGGHVNFLGSQTDGNLAQPNNEGHNGYLIQEIDQGLKGIPTGGRATSNNGGHWLDGGNGTGRSAINPGVVLLNIGTNNATDGDSAGTMETYLTNLLSDLKTDLPSAQIFVGSLTPRLDSTSDEAVEDAYNAAMPGIVASFGTNFHFVDIHDAVSASNINTVDGQHPTAAGYAQMGDAWYNALVAANVVAVPEPSTYALFGLGFLGLFAFGRSRRFRLKFRHLDDLKSRCRTSPSTSSRNGNQLDVIQVQFQGAAGRLLVRGIAIHENKPQFVISRCQRERAQVDGIPGNFS
jgi:lysophospholipase L1-like esterase